MQALVSVCLGKEVNIMNEHSIEVAFYFYMVRLFLFIVPTVEIEPCISQNVSLKFPPIKKTLQLFKITDNLIKHL